MRSTGSTNNKNIPKILLESIINKETLKDLGIAAGTTVAGAGLGYLAGQDFLNDAALENPDVMNDEYLTSIPEVGAQMGAGVGLGVGDYANTLRNTYNANKNAVANGASDEELYNINQGKSYRPAVLMGLAGAGLGAAGDLAGYDVDIDVPDIDIGDYHFDGGNINDVVNLQNGAMAGAALGLGSNIAASYAGQRAGARQK